MVHKYLEISSLIKHRGAGISTAGLWHYPAAITNPAIATEFAQFGKATGFNSETTAGVINNINGRQQVCFYHFYSLSSELTCYRWCSSSHSLLIGTWLLASSSMRGLIGQLEDCVREILMFSKYGILTFPV